VAVGHGINSLEVGRPSTPGQLGYPGRPDPDLASDQLLLTIGPHNQYIRTLFEEGLAGGIVLLGWFGGAVVTAARAVRRLLDPADRLILSGAAAGIVAFMLESAANDTLREIPTFTVVAVLSGLIVAYTARTRSPAYEGGP
jgi:O-antigen ligase